MPTLALDWSPPSAAAGDVGALGVALARHPRVGLFIDAESSPTRVDAMRLAALIGRLAPNTAVHPIASEGTGGLAEVIREDPPLLPTSGDNGRTQWGLPERLELDAERLGGWAAQGDGAVLVVGAVGIEAPIWRQLSSASVGRFAGTMMAVPIMPATYPHGMYGRASAQGSADGVPGAGVPV